MNESDQKGTLIDKLIGIQDLEAAKPAEAMDADLICECSDYIIELTGETPPSETALEQMKQRLLFRLFGRRAGRRRKGFVRKLLIAAIILLLIASLSAAMMTTSTSDESILHRWGYSLMMHGSGYRKDFDEYLSLITGDAPKEYKSIRAFVRKTGADVLVPTELPEGFEIEQVNVHYSYTDECINIQFITNDPLKVGIGVLIDKEFDSLESREKTKKIGDYECGFSFAHNWCQCEFNYMGNGYYIMTETYEDALLILKNLKGSLEK